MSGLSTLTGWLGSDIVFIASLFFIFLVFAMYFGRGRICSLILAYYPSVILFNSFPFTNKLTSLGSGEGMVALNQAAVFLIFFIPLNFIIHRSLFCDTGSEGKSFGKSVGLAFGALVLFVVFAYNVVNLDAFHNFSGTLDKLFSVDDYLFWWELAPLAIMGFTSLY